MSWYILEIKEEMDMKNFIIAVGDIIKVAMNYDVEAIVNANNKYMNYGCGVCGAIYNAAGIEQMETYCHNKWLNEMHVNEVRITPRFCFIKRDYSCLCTNLFSRARSIKKIEGMLLKFIWGNKKRRI